eukprot:77466_1
MLRTFDTTRKSILNGLATLDIEEPITPTLPSTSGPSTPTSATLTEIACCDLPDGNHNLCGLGSIHLNFAAGDTNSSKKHSRSHAKSHRRLRSRTHHKHNSRNIRRGLLERRTALTKKSVPVTGSHVKRIREKRVKSLKVKSKHNRRRKSRTIKKKCNRRISVKGKIALRRKWSFAGLIKCSKVRPKSPSIDMGLFHNVRHGVVFFDELNGSKVLESGWLMMQVDKGEWLPRVAVLLDSQELLLCP